ncbi:hypothetical protein ACTFIY_001751 [Dictyostelium cf. discoideum]
MSNNDNFENLFFKVYRNRYLNYLIFSFLSLYREYYSIDLGIDVKEILKYKGYFSYISKIKYAGCEPLQLENYSLPILKIFEIGYFVFRIDETKNPIYQVINPKSLPNTVEKVIFPNNDSNVDCTFLDSFPDSITTFENVNFKKRTDIKFPQQVTKLTFSSIFIFEIKENVLPKSLTHLEFGRYWDNGGFNLNLRPMILPQSIKTLNLGDIKQNIFHQYILPQSLTDLTLPNLPQSFENFPTTLKKLTINSNDNLTSHIDFKSNIFNNNKNNNNKNNSSIEILKIKSHSLLIELNSIPNSVKKLDIDVDLLHPLYEHMLPKSLKSLNIRVFVESFKFLKGSLPDGLEELNCIDRGLDNLEVGLLPTTLKSLSFNSINKHGFNKTIKEGFFPKNLKYLNLGYFNQQIQPIVSSSIEFTNNSLPNSLKYLNFGEVYNKPILPNSLPITLKKLIFSPFFNQKLMNNSFPLNLVFLEFGNNFNNQIPIGVLPKSLKVLIFGNRFNQILLSGSLPSSITHLIFGSTAINSSFNCPINENVLPSSLIHLELNCPRYSHTINESFLPKSLKSFIVSDNIKNYNLVI